MGRLERGGETGEGGSRRGRGRTKGGEAERLEERRREPGRGGSLDFLSLMLRSPVLLVLLCERAHPSFRERSLEVEERRTKTLAGPSYPALWPLDTGGVPDGSTSPAVSPWLLGHAIENKTCTNVQRGKGGCKLSGVRDTLSGCRHTTRRFAAGSPRNLRKARQLARPCTFDSKPANDVLPHATEEKKREKKENRMQTSSSALAALVRTLPRAPAEHEQQEVFVDATTAALRDLDCHRESSLASGQVFLSVAGLTMLSL